MPLVVVGPGVRKRRTVSQLASNIDLRPTFEELAGAKPGSRVEGRSLAGFLRGDKVRNWRRFALIEHKGTVGAAADPDGSTKRQGNPPSYLALRARNWLYVHYADPKRYGPEYYDLRRDAHQRRNVAARLSAKRQGTAARQVRRLHACDDATSCHEAERG